MFFIEAFILYHFATHLKHKTHWCSKYVSNIKPQIPENIKLVKSVVK